MRKYVIALTACAVAVCTPGQASASPNDDSFLVALRGDSVIVPMPVDPIRTAHGVCTNLQSGESFEAAARGLAGFPNPAAFVDLAIEYYCPQFKAR